MHNNQMIKILEGLRDKEARLWELAVRQNDVSVINWKLLIEKLENDQEQVEPIDKVLSRMRGNLDKLGKEIGL